MASQALYRKWRSQAFETVIGQEHVTLTLRNALAHGRMSHAYLFTGPRGTGKTSTARILAKAINCLEEDASKRPCNHCAICVAITEGRLLDLIEIDAASNRGIDEMRDLREKIAFRPNEARYKVYIIDEVHMLTKEAFNALLKTLEEPPPHAVFVLATTEPDRVPETVRSRCQRFDFRRIGTNDIVKHLSDLVQREGRRAESEALAAIARRSTGSMRDSISLLDQLLSYGDETLTLARVENVLGLVNQATIGKLVDHMAAGDAAQGLALLNELVTEGVELGQLADQVVAYLRAVMVARIAGSVDLLDLPQDIRAQMAKQAQRIGTPMLLSAVKEWTEARGALRDQVPGVPQLPLEMAFLRSAGAAIAAPPIAAQQQAVQPPAQGSVQPVRPPTEPAQQSSQPARPPAVSERAPDRPEPKREAPAEARAVPPSASAPPGPASAEDLQQRVNANWDRCLARSKQHGIQLQAALRAVKELEVVGHTLVLHFGSGQVFSHDVISKPENKARVEEIWREVLGEHLQVRCALIGESKSGAPKGRGDKDASSSGDALLEDARRRGAVVKQLD
jgi:DNA polymerase III subunit gamma/tau